MRINKKPTADQLDDYDIELIADKIEKTGRIELEVRRQIADDIQGVTRILEDRIDARVDAALKSGNLELCEDTVKAEVTLKLIKKLLEEEE